MGVFSLNLYKVFFSTEFLVICLFWSGLLLNAAVAGQSSDVLVLTDTADKHSAVGYLSYLKDKKGRLGIEDINKPDVLSKFQDVGNEVPNFGLTSAAYWFRFKVANGMEEPKVWWLEIEDPLLDRVDIYFYSKNDSDHTVRHVQTGDHYPLDQRRIKIRNPVLVMPFNANEELEVFIRLQTYGSMHLPVYFWKPEAFPPEALNLQIIYGIYFGIIISLLLYNLMLFISIKEIVYLYYCMFVGSYALWQFSYNGLGYEYLWSTNGDINLVVAILASNAYTFSMLLFFKSFLNVKKLFPKINKMVTAIMCLGALPLPIFFIFEKSTGVQTNVLFLLSALIIIFISAIYAFMKGVKEARYFLLAWIAFIVGVLVFCMMFIGWLPSNFFTIHGQQIGSATEAILLSFALAHRMRLLMQENNRIQTEAKQNLEKRVSERTNELGIAMQKLENAHKSLKEKSFNDGLTGVKNRLYLEEQFEMEWRRNRRYKGSLAILMIDIDYFKKVNDEYGHLCGDRALCFVADIITRVISRPSDIVARYGGEEFIVILPNTGSEGAYFLAERIRRELEKTVFKFNEHTLRLTASIGYAIDNESETINNPNELIDAADSALYQAKKNGRNQVVIAAA